jgi:hypothetical protein
MPRPRRHQLAFLPGGLRRFFHRQTIFPISPVPILNPQSHWRANRFSVPYAGKNVRPILLDFLPPAAPIPQLPPVQLMVNKRDIHRKRSWQPGNKSQQRLPVRFTCGVKVQHSLSHPGESKCSMQIENRSVSAEALPRPVVVLFCFSRCLNQSALRVIRAHILLASVRRLPGKWAAESNIALSATDCPFRIIQSAAHRFGQLLGSFM